MGVRRGASSHPRPLIIARAGIEQASRRRPACGGAVISRTCINNNQDLSTPPIRRRRDSSLTRPRAWTTHNLHSRPSGGSVSFGDDESSTVSSTVPPPFRLISFFVTYRRSGGAQPTQRIRFWRAGQGWSWGTCLRGHCERRPAH